MKARIEPIRAGVTDSAERNDCTVRALANVTGKPYTECHALLKTAGREDRQAVDPKKYFPVYLQCGAKETFVVGSTQSAIWLQKNFPGYKHIKGMTVKTLVEKLQDKKGSYIACTDEHAFAIVDGFIVDKQSNPVNKRVIALFKF